MKILVVDDETDVKVLFEQRFRKEIRSGEYTFTFAFSGGEALDYFNQSVTNVELILSDINMPGMNGIELLKSIRDVSPQAPPKVMMITAYGDVDTYNQVMSAGADDFLAKPLDFAELKQKLKNY